MPRQCAEIQRRARFSARILVDLVGGDSVRGCLIRGSPSSTTAVITSCAFDMADLPHGEGVNYVGYTSWPPATRPTGPAAFQHLRRPHTNARAISAALEDKIVRLRKTLDKVGYDAGAATIAEHLARDPEVTKVPALSTIWRILARRGFIVPQPHKRPRSAWKRFTAAQPNELWQADTTHWHLADGTEAEILNLLDDHSRLALASLARPTMTGPDVMDTFLAAFTRSGTPATVLTNNGAIFTATPRRGGRLSAGVQGRVGAAFARDGAGRRIGPSVSRGATMT